MLANDFMVKELGVDECLGFYVPPMIDNNSIWGLGLGVAK